jgi:NodT family efflux transporter outer membrane factor (OMF) lipoprotein
MRSKVIFIVSGVGLLLAESRPRCGPGEFARKRRQFAQRLRHLLSGPRCQCRGHAREIQPGQLWIERARQRVQLVHAFDERPVSLPSELVRQRPDILAAEATAHAASANIGVATAALLPNITLNGNLATISNSTGNLFSANSRAWSVGADASMPLFEGGTLWFRRKAALESYRQAMAAYRQTVFGAFEQVADSLRALDHDAEALQAENEALSTADQALRLIQANYQAGLANYLDVLNADAQYHQAKIADIQAIGVRYQDTVALFAALGGGWWNADRGDPGARAGARKGH